MRFFPAPKNQQRNKPASVVPTRNYILLAVYDCIASLLTTIGQIAVGSGLFQVVFSSKIIFSALLSRFYLGRALTREKWISIFVIVVGLIICVYNPAPSSTTPLVESMTDDKAAAAYVDHTKFIVGIVCVILAAFVFSASHIYSEFLMQEHDVSPFAFAASYGYYSVICCFIYLSTVTLYNSQTWIVEPLSKASHGSVVAVVTLFSILTCTSIMRSYGVFNVLAEYGTVTMGVLYALQSSIVFFSSALFLCDPKDPARAGQCLTTGKLIGSFIVVIGSMYYSYTSAKAMPSSSTTMSTSSSSGKHAPSSIGVNNSSISPVYASPAKGILARSSG
ncbi:hypothetical protein SAMD00019534_092440 [Acytostelium subglobosum LB1]|uniref:hypothetical protein n=1 Tax=Acytostelium subglobosum LB1 TaxID=1410327 RepID=UPI000644FB30|nr:hypothetical protein SAMD00019534_092440 [Acytostelium subglobosum LB1]GAM26069.1 hypothetical protein SAMD00019534_092440 [Acytostelium subglobosum LB1]|eukprot:XP_012751112.1 hypothetical protein SAMD00019534_092440 [Acytostelium subglobosum LB1]